MCLHGSSDWKRRSAIFLWRCDIPPHFWNVYSSMTLMDGSRLMCHILDALLFAIFLNDWRANSSTVAWESYHPVNFWSPATQLSLLKREASRGPAAQWSPVFTCNCQLRQRRCTSFRFIYRRAHQSITTWTSQTCWISFLYWPFLLSLVLLWVARPLHAGPYAEGGLKGARPTKVYDFFVFNRGKRRSLAMWIWCHRAWNATVCLASLAPHPDFSHVALFLFAVPCRSHRAFLLIYPMFLNSIGHSRSSVWSGIILA